MRHLNKKIALQGAGGKKPKPKPAILTPPKLGGFNVLSSYSVAEIIDLISDGPIECLVDQNGKQLTNDIFKGIYLDNTPIQNTEPEGSNIIATLDITSLANSIGNIWADGNTTKKYTYGSEYKFTNKPFSAECLFLQRDGKGFGYLLTAIPNFIDSLNTTYTTNNLPKLWKLNSNQVEIHRTNTAPFERTTVTANKGIVQKTSEYLEDLIISTTNETVRKFASDNVKKIKDLENFCKQIPEIPITNAASLIWLANSKNFYTHFILDVSGKFIGEFAGMSVNENISFGTSLNVSSSGDVSTNVILQPEIDTANNTYTGNVRGFVFLSIKLAKSSYHGFCEFLKLKPATAIALSKPSVNLIVTKGDYASSFGDPLFNFSNISCQFKDGSEFQEGLVGFDKVFNDYFYGSELLGKFIKTAAIQRIEIGPNNESFIKGIDAMALTRSNNQVLNGFEGSLDVRETGLSSERNYSDWNNENEISDYDSLAITHTFENPLTEKFAISIVVNSLSDTIHKTVENVVGAGKTGGTSKGTLEAGSKIPSIVIFKIEVGKISEGVKSDVKSFTYAVAGMIEGGCTIDLGGNYEDPKSSIRKSIKLIESDGDLLQDYFNTPFDLPSLNDDEDPTTTKRYVKVFKLSAETNSVLIEKNIALSKVTEIIDEKLSYPFSAIAGIKIDARAISSIPERSYDCRLKRIKIPSNYYPINDFTLKDKRYIKSAKKYTTLEPLYVGDWDGSFKEGWTDNPAWVLYDLLTSKRYGLGAYIDESQINKWELYKIAKFCDAVDDEGFFVGVSNGVGGLEPRYSCNILFKDQTKVYDAINIIANLFRGVVFFGGSEIHFLDDRPRIPIALFSNTNIKDGLFNYGNTRRDQQFNTVEVAYLDRFDNYKTKIEYVQDESDIRKRGVFKTTINTSGVTSRAMARRVGQHIIYQTTKENQTVTFTSGLESLLCRPGDLILVEDEMKTRSSNYGRVLAIDHANKTLRLDNQFLTGSFNGLITLYSPTGYATSDDLEQKSLTNRGRVGQFEITGNFLNDTGYASLQAVYKFSGYSSGYSQSGITNGLPEQFPVYTGKSSGDINAFYYYNTSVSGFVFSTGKAFQDNNQYDLIITNTGFVYGVEFDPSFVQGGANYTGFKYDTAVTNRRSSSISGQISGLINWDSDRYPLTQGILEDEINVYNIAQITKIAISGFDNMDYGSLVYLNQQDPNINLLTAVKEGSPYRLERKDATDQIYKVLSIREENQNEYSITATKYDTGKFEQIEKFITQDFLPDTYYKGPISVNNVDIRELNSPAITQFTQTGVTSSGFNLTGSWGSVSGATGYAYEVNNRLAGLFYNDTISGTAFSLTGLTSLGNWEMQVSAINNGSTFINSLPSKTGVFVAYSSNDSSINTLIKPAVISFTLE